MHHAFVIGLFTIHGRLSVEFPRRMGGTIDDPSTAVTVFSFSLKRPLNVCLEQFIRTVDFNENDGLAQTK